MAIFRPNFNDPIPNNPFYSPQSDFIQSAAGALIVGAGISINYATSVISATGGGGGGSGTVTSVATGAGLTGGPITTSGTISLANTAVTPGTYSYATFTVDSFGRITAASPGVSPVLSIIGVPPISVTGAATRLVSIAAASTTSPGAVQLFNGTNSTSTSLALTAAQGKNLQDQINALLVASNLTLAGTFNAATSQMLTVTSDGTAAGFVIGSNLPAPAVGNTDHFVIVTTPGTYNPPGPSGPFTLTSGDWLLSDGTQWNMLDVGTTFPYATTTVAGIVCLSTNALAQAGADTLTALTPAAARSAFVPYACYPALGDLIGGTAIACTPDTLSIGTADQVLTVDATSPVGFAWKTPAGGGIPCACITGKGALISGTAASTPTALAVGTNGQILVACSTAATGLCWLTAPYVPCCSFTAKGDLLVGTAASTLTALPIGTAGQVLVVDLACTSGVKWGNASAIPDAQPQVKGIMYGCTKNDGNTALGYCAGSGGFFNVHAGFKAAVGSGGSNNVVIGKQAGQGLTTGSSNTILGCGAGLSISTGSLNTLIGSSAGLSGPGSNNIMIGSSAGLNANGAHTDSVFIGRNAGYNYQSCGCSIIVGNNSTNTSNIAYPTLLIGNNLQMAADFRAVMGLGGYNCAFFELSGGFGWNFSSDARIKDGVTALPVNAESFINALRPVSYCFLDRQTKQPLERKHCNVGFIAQEVEQVMVDHGLTEITGVVTKPQDESDYYSLTDAGFTPFVVKAIQELSAKVSALQEEVNALKAKG